MKRALPTLGIALTLVAAVGCQSTQNADDKDHPTSMPEVGRAICVMRPTAGNSTAGTITFVQEGHKMTVTADISGLKAHGTHAFHIHEFGDITSSDGTATGGHYNPQGHDHGLPGNPTRHAGDFGNLAADANGHAQKVIVVTNITISGPENSILGRGMIIHAKADDGGQPTGNAGARIAQGVIGIDASE